MAKIIDNYILLEVIGQGSFGEVHKGRNLISKEAVAVKTIKLDRFLNDNSLRDMIINEIQALKKLEDSSIVRMIKMLKSANNIYLVYEFLNGGSLQKMLEERGTLTEKEALTIIFGVFKGFKTLITEKIIHRNMNPGNLFFNDGVVKVKNFFCCKSPVSQKNFPPENIAYSAPEILLKSGYEDKTDMFSIGLIFYKMIFGCLPFDENMSQEDLAEYYLTAKKDGFKVSGLSDFAQSMIEGMLIFDPNRRTDWDKLFALTEEPTKDTEFTNSAATSHVASTNFDTLGQNFYLSQQTHNFSTQQQVQSVQQDVLKRRTTNSSQLNEFSKQVTQSTQNLRISGKENMDTSMQHQNDKFFAKTMEKELAVPVVASLNISQIVQQIQELRKGFFVNLNQVTKILDLDRWVLKVKPDVCVLLLLKKAIKQSQEVIDYIECPDNDYDRKWDTCKQRKELQQILRRDQEDLVKQFWRLQPQLTDTNHSELQTLEINDPDYVNDTLSAVHRLFDQKKTSTQPLNVLQNHSNINC